MRLDKFLKETGICSRSDAKKILKQGIVSVNDKIIKDDGYKIDENNDVIKYNNEVISYQEFVYLMMNKPAGVLSATEDKFDTTIIDLVKEYKHKNLFPFGRLDKDSVGLVILSDDGKLAHELLSPKKHVSKKYYLKVKGNLDENDIEKFSKGVILEDGYKCKNAILEILKSDDISECYVTISEGKFHQLKRMFKMIGKEVIYLKRITFGNIVLDSSLSEGEYRSLTKDEIQMLKNLNK